MAIDRTSKFAFAELHPHATQALAVDFLCRVLSQIPYKVHKVLTDNGIQFRNLPHHTQIGRHPFGQLCDEWGIEQRFTKPAHPWTNGQVERLNRTVKQATIKRYHYETMAELTTHLLTFLVAYNYAKRLKRLKGLTPYEFICAKWRKNPTIFHHDPTCDPLPHIPGPYIKLVPPQPAPDQPSNLGSSGRYRPGCPAGAEPSPAPGGPCPS